MQREFDPIERELGPAACPAQAALRQGEQRSGNNRTGRPRRLLAAPRADPPDGPRRMAMSRPGRLRRDTQTLWPRPWLAGTRMQRGCGTRRSPDDPIPRPGHCSSPRIATPRTSIPSLEARRHALSSFFFPSLSRTARASGSATASFPTAFRLSRGPGPFRPTLPGRGLWRGRSA